MRVILSPFAHGFNKILSKKIHRPAVEEQIVTPPPIDDL